MGRCQPQTSEHELAEAFYDRQMGPSLGHLGAGMQPVVKLAQHVVLAMEQDTVSAGLGLGMCN